jgi:hypothetical protein
MRIRKWDFVNLDKGWKKVGCRVRENKRGSATLLVDASIFLTKENKSNETYQSLNLGYVKAQLNRSQSIKTRLAAVK